MDMSSILEKEPCGCTYLVEPDLVELVKMCPVHQAMVEGINSSFCTDSGKELSITSPELRVQTKSHRGRLMSKYEPVPTCTKETPCNWPRCPVCGG